MDTSFNLDEVESVLYGILEQVSFGERESSSCFEIQTTSEYLENLIDDEPTTRKAVKYEPYRRAESIASIGTLSEWESDGDDDEYADFVKTLDQNANSDEEFDKICDYSYNSIKKIHMKEYPAEVPPSMKKSKPYVTVEGIENEYDVLPPIEKLSINCPETLNLKVLGVVTKAVGCLVTIQSEATEVLDFDSVVFDEKKNPIGMVYDIFGQVKTPNYAVRFNSDIEASSVPVGMKVYYASNNEEYAKTPFKGLNVAAMNRSQLADLNKSLDKKAIQERKDGMSDVEFSDDNDESNFEKAGNPESRHPEQRKRNRGGQRVTFGGNGRGRGAGGRGSHQEPRGGRIYNNYRKNRPAESDPYASPYAEFL